MDQNCLDCKHCYVDNLFYECMCDLGNSVCRNNELEIEGVCDWFENASEQIHENAHENAARETMKIVVNGKPVIVYKDDIERELWKHLGVGLINPLV